MVGCIRNQYKCYEKIGALHKTIFCFNLTLNLILVRSFDSYETVWIAKTICPSLATFLKRISPYWKFSYIVGFRFMPMKICRTLGGKVMPNSSYSVRPVLYTRKYHNRRWVINKYQIYIYPKIWKVNLLCQAVR